MATSRRLSCRCAFLAARRSFTKLEADFFAVDADQAAAAIGQAGRGQQQEKLLELQPLDRSFNGKPRACRRNIQQGARSPPCAIDAHDVNSVTAGESNPIRFSRAPGHVSVMSAASYCSGSRRRDGKRSRCSSWHDENPVFGKPSANRNWETANVRELPKTVHPNT